MMVSEASPMCRQVPCEKVSSLTRTKFAYAANDPLPMYSKCFFGIIANLGLLCSPPML